jgi:hypothetical protein
VLTTRSVLRTSHVRQTNDSKQSCDFNMSKYVAWCSLIRIYLRSISDGTPTASVCFAECSFALEQANRGHDSLQLHLALGQRTSTTDKYSLTIEGIPESDFGDSVATREIAASEYELKARVLTSQHVRDCLQRSD